MTVIIDNYDSFTYNLVHLVKELNEPIDVVRNDQFKLNDLNRYDRIILSPGPGVPHEAGLTLEVIRAFSGKKPILGVCLGEQAIGEAFGAKIINLKQVFHGIQSEILLTDDILFCGLSQKIAVGRYHSWVVSKEDFPNDLKITAVTADGLIMALRHRYHDTYGIQFHPESVLTPSGKTIIKNFLSI